MKKKIKILLERKCVNIPGKYDAFGYEDVSVLISKINALNAKLKGEDAYLMIDSLKQITDGIMPQYQIVIIGINIPEFKGTFLNWLIHIDNFSKYWDLLKY